MHQDSVHGDLLVRGENILRRARAVVQKQETLIVRLQAEGEDTLHAEAVLDLYRQTLQIFLQTFYIIARKQGATESDAEDLRQLMNRHSRH